MDEHDIIKCHVATVANHMSQDAGNINELMVMGIKNMRETIDVFTG